MTTSISTNHPNPSGWTQSPRLQADGSYVIQGHAAVTQALKDERFARSLAFTADTPVEKQCPWLRFRHLFKAGSPKHRSPGTIHNIIKNSFFFQDGEDHDRLLAPVKKLFLARLQAVQDMLAPAAEDRIAGAVKAGLCEWNQDVVKPYLSAGFNSLFDFPDGAVPDIHRWFTPTVLIRMIEPRSRSFPRRQYEDYLRAVDFIEKCLDSPDLKNTGGLMLGISRLSGKPTSFTHEEILANTLFLLMAASFSIPRTLAKTVKTLVHRPDLVQQLRDNPALISSAAQEFLRLHTPAPVTQRKLTEDVEIGNVSLKKGDWIHIDLMSANMDSSVFESPGEIIPGRSPNPHFSFGGGAHYCLGAPLARMQIEAFLKAFLDQSRDVLFEEDSSGNDDPSSRGKIWIRAGQR